MQDKPAVRCPLVAQVSGSGERLCDIFAGTPSLIAVEMLLNKVLRSSGKLGMLILDIKCAFVYGFMRRRVYFELPDQDPKSKEQQMMGRLVKATYGARNAPEILSGEVKREMNKSGFVSSVFHPSAFIKTSCDIFVGCMSMVLCASVRGMSWALVCVLE